MDFKMTGSLKFIKDTDKMKGFEHKVYDSGFETKTLKFNAICGDNSHMLVAKGMNGKIYTNTRDTKDESGATIKGEQLIVEFDKRKSVDVNTIAGFKLYTIDLEDNVNLRRKLIKISESESVTDESLAEVGCTTLDEVKEKLEKSIAKKHEFISMWDFTEFLNKVITSGKFDNRLFNIRGSVEYSYWNENIYKNYVPTKIYLAPVDATPECVGVIRNFLYSPSTSIDKENTDKGYVYINGWEMPYMKSPDLVEDRKNKPVDVRIAFPLSDIYKDKADGTRVDMVARYFGNGGLDRTIVERGIEFNMLDGSQKTTLTLEDLTEEEQEDIELGMYTLEDVIASRGGTVYGERVREYVFTGLHKGKNADLKINETAYSLEDMDINTYLKVNNISDDYDELPFDDDDLI